VAQLSLLLLAVLTACALSMVTSQHQARKLFIELEQQQERTRQLDVEYGQLQLESSTWAMHSRVERIARQALRLKLPESGRVKIIEFPPRETAGADTAAGDRVGPGTVTGPSNPAAPVAPAGLQSGASQ
jgi:cell division protein FtsL